MTIPEKYKSRKFQLAVSAVLIALGSAIGGQIEWSQAITAIVFAVLGYIGVEGIADIKATKEGTVKR